MESETAKSGKLRIGELSRRVGVSPNLLRAGETRYGLLQPRRSSGNFRLYSEADERRVRLMQAEMARGLSAAEAARAALQAGDSAPGDGAVPPGHAEELREALEKAGLALDEGVVQQTLDRAFALLTLDQVLSEVILPCFRQIGGLWERGEASVAQEHFASNVVRSRLVALTRGWDQGSGSRAVLACLPGEQHDIGLLCFGLALWNRGWRIVYLGQATPVADMEIAAASGDIAAVLAYSQSADLWRSAEDDLAALASKAHLALGGEGIDAAVAERI